jgi:hypothetical protein
MPPQTANAAPGTFARPGTAGANGQPKNSQPQPELPTPAAPHTQHVSNAKGLRGPNARPEGNHKGQTQPVTLTWRHDALVQA